MKCKDVPLFDAISGSARKKLTHLIPQELSNTAWAFAELSFADDPLLDSIASSAGGRVSQFRPLEIRMLTWSLSRRDDLS